MIPVLLFTVWLSVAVQSQPFDAKVGGLTMRYRSDWGEATAVPVDLSRYAGFLRCMKGPSWFMGQLQRCWPSLEQDQIVSWVCFEIAPRCEWWDSDKDDDVDLADFAAFQRGYGE